MFQKKLAFRLQGPYNVRLCYHYWQENRAERTMLVQVRSIS